MEDLNMAGRVETCDIKTVLHNLKAFRHNVKHVTSSMVGHVLECQPFFSAFLLKRRSSLQRVGAAWRNSQTSTFENTFENTHSKENQYNFVLKTQQQQTKRWRMEELNENTLSHESYHKLLLFVFTVFLLSTTDITFISVCFV